MTVSTLASIPAPAAIYREEQMFGWWVYAVISALLLVSGTYLTNRPEVGQGHFDPIRSGILVAAVSLPVLVVCYLRMSTLVAAGVVQVWYGWIPTYKRAIDATSIARVEVVAYEPLKDCGGWGIRAGKDGERVLNARGDRGVRLHFRDGSRLLIGSQQPELLASAIEREIPPEA